MSGQSLCGKPLPSIQFCCEPEIAPKKKSILKLGETVLTEHAPLVPVIILQRGVPPAITMQLPRVNFILF